MAARIPWYLKDYTADALDPEVYAWPVNPAEFTLPFTKKLAYESTAAPDGRTLIFEGRDEVQRISFSGSFLTEDQYNDFIYWFGKRHQLQLVDDLGREMWIYITSFSMSRKRSTQFPWRHTYNGEMIILDWAS